MADRVRRYDRDSDDDSRPVSIAVQRAVSEHAVIEIEYLTGEANRTTREVEPIGVVAIDDDWFLVGWCRLRDAARTFRIDRITEAHLTGEIPPARDPEHFLDVPPLNERSGPLS